MFAIYGEAQRDVIVDIIRPNSTQTEPVWEQFIKTFVDTDEGYIHRLYTSTYWPAGVYQLRIEPDGVTKFFGAELN